MTIQFNKRYLLPAVALVAIAVTAGCGDESDEAPAAAADIPAIVPVPMASYNAPGSNWDFDLHDDGSYNISRSAMPGMSNDLSASGDYQVTNQGFLSMIVDESTGVDAPAAASAIWGIEVPGYALLLSPVSAADDNFIPMVGGDTCPNTDLSNNWINVRANLSGDATSPTGSYFGSLTYKYADGATNLESQYALSTGNPDQGVVSLGNGYCQAGVVNSATSNIYLSTSGSATVHANASDAEGGQFVFSLPKSTISSVDALDGSYAGMYSDDGATSGQKVQPVVVTCVAGSCSADFIDDVDAGTTAGQPFTMDLSGSINVPAPGLTTGQIDVNGIDSSIGCMIDENLDGSGRRMISCAGQSPTRNYRLFNLILTSND